MSIGIRLGCAALLLVPTGAVPQARWACFGDTCMVSKAVFEEVLADAGRAQRYAALCGWIKPLKENAK